MWPGVVKRGPFRPYISYDVPDPSYGAKIERVDVIYAVILGISFVLKQLAAFDSSAQQTPMEKDLMESVNHFKEKNFFLMSFPPLAVEIIGLFASTTGSVSIALLRRANLAIAALTVSAFYLALRKSDIVRVVAMVAAAGLSHLPLFAEESLHLSLNVPQLALLSCCLLSWNSFKRSQAFSRGWYWSLTMLSTFLAFASSIKFVGVVTWSWFIILIIKQLWEIVGDVNISTCKILRHTAWRFAAVVFVPFAFLVSTYFLLISNSRGASLDHSSLVSPYFKSWFLPQPMPQPDVVYYGSSILIRHAQSLGGYLHSHNHTYETGSQEQQVTLFDFSNNGDNEWIIEPSDQNLNAEKQLEPVKNGAVIRLRHKSTGKLLRSSSAKAPVSEQDYDHEVSCTGDNDYKGDSDESWRLRFERGKTPHDGLLCPFTIYFSLENEGQSCKLLSHDQRLPDWGFGQQEVLCVDSASKERSLFFIDRSNLYKERGAYLTYPKQSKLKRLWNLSREYIKRQYKYDYYLKNKDFAEGVSAENWIWNSFDSVTVNFIWFIPLGCVAMYVMTEITRWITWNPWAAATPELESEKRCYLDSCLELSIGWFMHYQIFTWSKHQNLTLAQYLPSYLLSLLVAAHTANYVWRHSKLGRLALVLFALSAGALTFQWA